MPTDNGSSAVVRESVLLRMRASVRGMTIIELMFVVTIVLIITSIAIPAFQEYRFKSRQTEAQANIAAIRVSQEAHFASFDSYANIDVPHPPLPPSSNKQVWAPAACPPACTRLTPAACDSFGCLGFAPSAAVFFRYVSPSANFGPGLALNEFSIGSDGDVDNDGNRVGYVFQTANGGGGIGVVPDPISTCGPMPADAVHRCTPMYY